MTSAVPSKKTSSLSMGKSTCESGWRRVKSGDIQQQLRSHWQTFKQHNHSVCVYQCGTDVTSKKTHKIKNKIRQWWWWLWWWDISACLCFIHYHEISTRLYSLCCLDGPTPPVDKEGGALSEFLSNCCNPAKHSALRLADGSRSTRRQWQTLWLVFWSHSPSRIPLDYCIQNDLYRHGKCYWEAGRCVRYVFNQMAQKNDTSAWDEWVGPSWITKGCCPRI